MAQNLATIVTRQQVLTALQHIIKQGVSLRPSTGYDLVFNSQRFPPKDVVRKAAELAGIQNIGSYRLNGGEPTNAPLRQMGFTVVSKNEAIIPTMMPKEFIQRIVSFLRSVPVGEDFGTFKFEGWDSKISYSSRGGAWVPSDYPAVVFNDGSRRYYVRFANTPSASYIVLEMAHRPSQLRNFQLEVGYTFINDHGTVSLKENYVMTISQGRASSKDVGAAMLRAGFTSDGIITCFEEAEMDESGIIRDILDWAVTQENAKDIYRQGIPTEPRTYQQMGALNTILYGPPGTGKTYRTILSAVRILFPDRHYAADAIGYKAAKDDYTSALGDQVEFVTFHQNYSYEDFVAGLRPDTNVTDTLTFKDYKGVFYSICERARKNLKLSQEHATYTEPDFQDVFDEFLQPLRNTPKEEIQLATDAEGVPFYITDINKYNLSFRKNSGGTGHTLSFNTMREMFEDRRDYPLSGVGIYLHPVVARLRQMAEDMRTMTEPVTLKPYVLIIDEINRANISRVFGELITLLEEDKRLGNDNGMEISLPNGERFSVPKNLYVIGTMNTADKSIALIDIALRRRFVFEDMYPRTEIINDLVDKGLIEAAFGIFLNKLNSAILQEKKSADFLIGHAYFMKGSASSFDQLMNTKIIPLLNEYFYNDRQGTVLAILSNAQPPEGYFFEQDPYLGVTCKAISHGTDTV